MSRLTRVLRALEQVAAWQSRERLQGGLRCLQAFSTSAQALGASCHTLQQQGWQSLSSTAPSSPVPLWALACAPRHFSVAAQPESSAQQAMEHGAASSTVHTPSLVEALRALSVQTESPARDAQAQLVGQQLLPHSNRLSGPELTTLLSVMRELSKPGRDVPVLHKQLLPVVLAGLASPRGLSHVTDVVQLDKLAHTFSVLSLWHTVAKDSGFCRAILQRGVDILDVQGSSAVQATQTVELGTGAADRQQEEAQSVCRLLQKACKDFEPWLQLEDKRQLIRDLLPHAMARLPYWPTTEESAAWLLFGLDHANYQSDPVPVIYALATIHHFRTTARSETISTCLHILGKFSKRNLLFSGALLTPSMGVLGQRAQEDIARLFSPDPSPWVWPPELPFVDKPADADDLSNGAVEQGVGGQLGVDGSSTSGVAPLPEALVRWRKYTLEDAANPSKKAGGSETDPPSFYSAAPDYIQPTLPALTQIPRDYAPGAPLHWQDGPCVATSTNNAHLRDPAALPGLVAPGAPPAAAIQAAIAGVRQYPVLAMVEGLCAELLARVEGGAGVSWSDDVSAKDVSRSMWGTYQLRMQSEPLFLALLKLERAKLEAADPRILSMLAISLGNLHYMGRSGPLVAALVDILCMQVQRIKETGPAIRQDVINGMWALSVSDHPGSANTRAYLARALKAWDESGWQDLHVLSARQITQYLTVLRELEWERARLAKRPDLPETVWERVPEDAGGPSALMPWEQGWLQDIEEKLRRHAGLDKGGVVRDDISAFQGGVLSTLTRMARTHTEAWLMPRSEMITYDGALQVDLTWETRERDIKLAVEADGPWHFAVNDTALLLGPTARRIRSLARRGYDQLIVPYYTWSKMRWWYDKVQALRQDVSDLLHKILPDDLKRVTELIPPAVTMKQVWDYTAGTVQRPLADPYAVLEDRRGVGIQLLQLAEDMEKLERESKLAYPWKIADKRLSSTQDTPVEYMKRTARMLIQQADESRAAFDALDRPVPQRREIQALAEQKDFKALANQLTLEYQCFQSDVEVVRASKHLIKMLQQLQRDLSQAAMLHPEMFPAGLVKPRRTDDVERQHQFPPTTHRARPEDQSTATMQNNALIVKVFKRMPELRNDLMAMIRHELKLRASVFNAESLVLGSDACQRYGEVLALSKIDQSDGITWPAIVELMTPKVVETDTTTNTTPSATEASTPTPTPTATPAVGAVERGGFGAAGAQGVASAVKKRARRAVQGASKSGGPRADWWNMDDDEAKAISAAAEAAKKKTRKRRAAD